MNRIRVRLESWRAAWRDFSRRFAPRCAYCDSIHLRNQWRRMRRRSRGVRIQGARYCCRPECLERALLEVLGRTRPAAHRAAVAPRRIPLGLLLLSRQQLSAEQLRTALAAQRADGCGSGQNKNSGQNKKKIGAWLQELGFSTELEITAALARQWSCPVLRSGRAALGEGRLPAIFPGIPVPLLESFQMMPVELVGATGTLLIAFSEGIDYTVLLAIEQMLGYRTEACLMCPSVLRKSLQALRERGASDVVFERMEDTRECANIIGSYSAKVKAEEIRVARCGDYLWIRLERLREEAVTLLLRTSETSSRFSVLSSQ
jgi:hypothetical protein